MQSQNEAFNAKSGMCGPNRDLLVLKWWSYQCFGCSRLYKAWLFYEKLDALRGALLNLMCNLKIPKELGRLKSIKASASENEKYRTKTLNKRRKGFEENAVEAEGQTYELCEF